MFFMRDNIRKILKEDRLSSYIDGVVNDFLKGVTITDITIDFETSGELRDLGWDDEMLSFAYEQYGDYGFTQDPEDEDSFYYEGSDHIWDLEEVLMDMFYIFIDERVKTGEFVETPHGWEIKQHMWDVETRDGWTYIFDYICRTKTYSSDIKYQQLEGVLIEKYGVPNQLIKEVIDNIVLGVEGMLNKEKKFCW